MQCATRLLSLLSQTDGWTPLHAASHAGHVEVVRALLVGGATVNQAKVRWHLPCTASRYLVLDAPDSMCGVRGHGRH